jgi:hypothetical protein
VFTAGPLALSSQRLSDVARARLQEIQFGRLRGRL